MKSLVLGASAVALALSMSVGGAAARDQIRIVGSSTVFPFTTAVAERFGQGGQFPAPVVESTGTGGGVKLFCEGVGENTPDFVNASRPIKASEIETCKKNGVTPVEIKVGFDGIVIAGSKGGPAYDLTKEELFKALAKNVVVDGKTVANPYQIWAEIDPSLPAEQIEVLGPPPTSGTRDAFVELVMTASCPAEIKEADEKACGQLREDGKYVEAGENDNLIVQKIEANPAAVGIFGFSFLDQNGDKLQGHKIDGVDPTFENIADGKYGISRSLYIYAKKEHAGVIPGMAEFIAEYTNDAAWGPEGYLADKGLIPLPDDQRTQSAEDAKAMKGMGS